MGCCASAAKGGRRKGGSKGTQKSKSRGSSEQQSLASAPEKKKVKAKKAQRTESGDAKKGGTKRKKSKRGESTSHAGTSHAGNPLAGVAPPETTEDVKEDPRSDIPIFTDMLQIDGERKPSSQRIDTALSSACPSLAGAPQAPPSTTNSANRPSSQSDVDPSHASAALTVPQPVVPALTISCASPNPQGFALDPNNVKAATTTAAFSPRHGAQSTRKGKVASRGGSGVSSGLVGTGNKATRPDHEPLSMVKLSQIKKWIDRGEETSCHAAGPLVDPQDYLGHLVRLERVQQMEQQVDISHIGTVENAVVVPVVESTVTAGSPRISYGLQALRSVDETGSNQGEARGGDLASSSSSNFVDDILAGQPGPQVVPLQQWIDCAGGVVDPQTGGVGVPGGAGGLGANLSTGQGDRNSCMVFCSETHSQMSM